MAIQKIFTISKSHHTIENTTFTQTLGYLGPIGSLLSVGYAPQKATMEPAKNMEVWFKSCFLSQMLNLWHIFTYIWPQSMVNVGKITSYVEHLGLKDPFHQYLKAVLGGVTLQKQALPWPLKNSLQSSILHHKWGKPSNSYHFPQVVKPSSSKFSFFPRKSKSRPNKKQTTKQQSRVTPHHKRNKFTAWLFFCMLNSDPNRNGEFSKFPFHPPKKSQSFLMTCSI